MKKWILSLALLLATAPAFAAVATITKTEYGYEITGGTSATVIDTGRIYVKKVSFMGATIGDTGACTSGASNLSCMQFKNVTANDSANNTWSATDGPTPFDNFTVTLSATGDILYIYTQ